MGQRLLLLVHLVAMLIGLATSICDAGILTIEKFQHEGGPARRLILEGRIEVGDSSKIFDAILDTRDPVLQILIASPGGDVEEAVWISAYLNATFIKVFPAQTGLGGVCNDDNVTFDENCVCYSACAIIWLAAERKIAGESIGVHRPYFEKKYFAGLSLEEAKRQYESKLKDIANYLQQQSVPERIVEKMVSTPSTDIQLLSQSDIDGLLLTRPYISELLDARCMSASDRHEQVEVDQAMSRAIREGDVASQVLIALRIEESLFASPYRNCVASEEYRAAKQSQEQNPFSIIVEACRKAPFLANCRPAAAPNQK